MVIITMEEDIMYCQECGTKNDDTDRVCKKCKSYLVKETGGELFGYRCFANCSDQTVGKIIFSIGIILLITAIIPFFILETKDLITVERMRLILSMPLGFIAILLIIIGLIIYYGLQRRCNILQHVQNDYRRIVENSNDSIFVIDHEGRFTYLNDAAYRLSGYMAGELLGTNFLQVVAPEYRESTIENFKKREKGHASDRYNIEIISKDGHRKAIELSLKTLEYKGEFMGVEGIAREIIIV